MKLMGVFKSEEGSQVLGNVTAESQELNCFKPVYSIDWNKYMVKSVSFGWFPSLEFLKHIIKPI